MNKSLQLILFIFFLTSCGHVTLVRSSTKPEVTPVQTRTINSYFWGLSTARLPSEDRICPDSKIEDMEFYSTSGDVILSVITLGIYIPHRMDFECARHRMP